MEKQRGVTISGFIFFAVLAIIVAVFALRVVPAYIEYWSVKKVLATMANEPNFKDMTVAEIRKSFARRAQIDDIGSVTADDLDIERDRDHVVVGVKYQRKVHMVAQISACMDFEASVDSSRAR